jgi:hypothetical protein
MMFYTSWSCKVCQKRNWELFLDHTSGPIEIVDQSRCEHLGTNDVNRIHYFEGIVFTWNEIPVSDKL